MARRAAIALVVLCSGCFSMRYLAQAGNGERKMLGAARPLSKVIADPKTDPRIALLLARVPEVKKFGESHGLKPTTNYGRYADLHRAAAVWVVEACAELSFTPKRWSFPIAGTVPYLGFFHEAEARAYAAKLGRGGSLDVDVREASAFSTLGWFRDPVLSTMIRKDDDALGELANVVLHESVHATVYVRTQSAFDESLASFVADRITPEWLAQAAGSASPEAKAWGVSEERQRVHVARFQETWKTLDDLYRSAASDADKRSRKAKILAAITLDLHLREAPNNATLAGFRTYDTGGDAFRRLLDSCGGDWSRFLHAAGTLRKRDFPRAQMEEFSPLVDALAAKGCAR